MAFSRDEADKKYVQNRLFEQRKELLRWLEEGACIYVCGLLKMAAEVQECIIEICKADKGLTQQQAEECLHQLKAEKRHCEDAY